MERLTTILSITGSDSTGGAGIQGDIRTIGALGAYAVTALTSVAVQNSQGIHSVFNLPTNIIGDQIRSLLNDIRPNAIKIGMVGTPDIIDAITKEIHAMPNIVCGMSIESSQGRSLMDNDAIDAMKRTIWPMTDILVLKFHDAEILLNHSIVGSTGMIEAATELIKSGPKAVLICGGRHAKGVLTNVLMANDNVSLFTLPDTDNWKTHGIHGSLSSAITTFLAMGESTENAVARAHDYIKSLVLYSLESSFGITHRLMQRENSHDVSNRQMQLYNMFMEHVANCHKQIRDTHTYANMLCVTHRYLAQITRRVAGKSPKQLIAEYITNEAERLLLCTQKTIQEVAFEFGFSSQSQFATYFKKIKGVSPSKLR
ncbi:MAG: hydroxymethylpyrimidine/phosphomethylpyrimidine kinase [Bacteroidales bacterium]|nr:hydroxymethylpyrimidine/phosphomethylpyrimidine kinase [Bacteroidales bacterium]